MIIWWCCYVGSLDWWYWVAWSYGLTPEGAQYYSLATQIGTDPQIGQFLLGRSETAGIALSGFLNLKFCHLHFQAWKMHGICSKSWNFNTKPGNNFKFCVSRFSFQDVIYKKIWFTSLSHLHYQHKHWLEPNGPGISLFLPGKYIVSSEKWEPYSQVSHLRFGKMEEWTICCLACLCPTTLT